ncbi:MAG: FMN-binding protein [Erysipelotrichaceae bacterium]|nr:FMN-binding protein [Erysipelotrichaceae bacterium]
MKKVLHLTLFLALVAAIAGGALAFANSLTAPIVAANALAAEKENLALIFPDASDDDFKEIAVKDSETIEKIFQVAGKGTVFKLQVSGYKEGTSFMVALDDQAKIIDYVVISNGDTQGIGTKVADASFHDALVGKNAEDELDIIAGATVSSRPVVDGIHEAGKYLLENLK